MHAAEFAQWVTSDEATTVGFFEESERARVAPISADSHREEGENDQKELLLRHRRLREIRPGRADPEPFAAQRESDTPIFPDVRAFPGGGAPKPPQLHYDMMEAFGGAGYIEDTHLPVLLRDAQVLPIWEGTTNVLALDTLRAIGPRGLAPLAREAGFILGSVRDKQLVALSARIQAALEAAQAWWQANAGRDQGTLEAGARRFALTLGRSTAAALLARQAQWSLDHENDRRPLAAALRFASHGINVLADNDLSHSAALVDDS